MTALFVLVGIAVFAGAFVVGTGRLGTLPDSDPDYRPSPVGGDVQFDVVVRGYRMDEVDAEMERLQREVDRLSGVGEPPQGSTLPGDPEGAVPA